MNITIHNIFWNIRMFWKRNVERHYIDYGATAPFLLNSRGIDI